MRSKKQVNKLPKFTPTVQLFCAIGLFVISVLATRGQSMTEGEIVIFRLIYGLPDELHSLFFFITQLGSIHMLAVLLVLYLIKRRYHIVLRVLLTGLLAYLISGFAKDIWGRMRPHELLIDVVNRDYIVRGPGFPSGHVALATAMALVVGHYLPRKYHWVVMVVIAGVSLSRIYLGIHAPWDIVGGFAIGWFSYALFRHVRLQDVSTNKKHTN